MSSLIEGYIYDIFISYRQKDNKYDGWVTEFVDNLRKELEATFKEEVSVYFDINPRDGLLETHDVGASLKEKLKCLVFIPVISQTYCDSSSFAWQNEMVAFNKMAKGDQFGRDIRLAGGNVASRILPVKIHDLDQEDKILLESELGGVLRSIEFIYKAPGVNRPLRANEDHPQDNINKTYYRDQINKVANAVKEIISAIRKQDQPDGKEIKQVIKAKINLPQKQKSKIIVGSFLLFSLIFIGYFLIPKLFKSTASVEKTIAVLPFENMSDDEEHAWFGDAMTDEIIMQLFKVNEFTVRSRNSVMQYKGTTKTSPSIGKELRVNYLIGGSAQRIDDNIKIRVQLINAVTDIPLWAETFAGNWKDVLNIQSEIARQIADKLKTVLTPEENDLIDKKLTENPEAYNYYLQGNYYDKRSVALDRKTAISLYEKAIVLDPEFALAYLRMASCYLKMYFYFEDRSEEILRKSKQAIDKAFQIDPDLPECHLILGEYYYRGYFNYAKALEQFDEVLKEQPGNSTAIFLSASANRRAGNWDLSIAGYIKAFELDPRSFLYAWETAKTFELLRDYSRAEEYYNIAHMFQPDYGQATYPLVQVILKKEGNTAKARELLLNGIKNNKSLMSDSLIVETKLQLDIYDGKYEEALITLSQFRSDEFQIQFYYMPKYLYYANIYGLMNKSELAHTYYDSARVYIEKKIAVAPSEARLYAALGIAYAGLGLEEMAVNESKKAVIMLPMKRSALEGSHLIQNLAQTYVMVGKYSEALEQIKYLLSIPGDLSVKMLKLDPCWAPLIALPEFKKILKTYSEN